MALFSHLAKMNTHTINSEASRILYNRVLYTTATTTKPDLFEQQNKKELHLAVYDFYQQLIFIFIS